MNKLILRKHKVEDSMNVSVMTSGRGEWLQMVQAVICWTSLEATEPLVSTMISKWETS